MSKPQPIPEAADNTNLLLAAFVISKPVCTVCHQEVVESLSKKEPSWLHHQKCADAFMGFKLHFAKTHPAWR